MLHELKYQSAVEIHSSTSQPTLHGFLDCVIFIKVEHFTAILFDCLCQMLSVVLENDTPFHWALFTKCMSQFFECLNMASHADDSPFGNKTAGPDECVNFLIVAFNCGTSQLTTAWMISNIHVSALKHFTHSL
jgi:hypothetical protein